MQDDITKGDYHHEKAESEQAHGAAAACAHRLDRRSKCGELLYQPSTLAQVTGGEMRQEAGFVL